MSKLAKEVKKGVKSAARTVKRAAKGDINAIMDTVSLGATAVNRNLLRKTGKELTRPLKPPKLPDQIVSGAGQINVQEQEPNVDLAATESSRRESGRAVGLRKLRVPLGGLR